MNGKVDQSLFASVIVVDVETTGLNANQDEILQIAASAAFSDSAEMFNIFVNPVCDEITPTVTKLTGISKHDEILYVKKAQVASEPLTSALNMFLSYLDRQPQPVMFVAHSARFDAKFLLSAFAKCNLLEEFLCRIAGFSCSLAAARKNCPKVQCEGLNNHKLQTLYTYFVNSEEIDFHTAAKDVLALKKIMPFMMKSKEEVAKFSMSNDSLSKYYPERRL